MSQPARRYRAFISYSHRDRAWAEWLHKAIEGFRVPRPLIGRPAPHGPVPPRLFPLFRDRDELPASADLSAGIRDALAASGHLIVICSPAAAASRWVNEEIIAFKRLHGEDRILAVIVDGDPDSTDPATAALPPALRLRLGPDGALSDTAVEPAGADARDSGDGRANALLKTVAGLIGVGLGELTRREAEAQKRRFRLMAAAAFAFAVLAAAAVWFAINAARERARAETNLQAGIDAAQTMIFDIAQKSTKAVGAQQSVLADILRQSRDLLDRLSADQTLTPRGRRNAAAAQHELARALLRAGDTEGAHAAAERSLAIIAAEADAAPDDPDLQRERSVSLEGRAEILTALDEDDAARADLEQSLAIRAGIAAKTPTQDARLDLAVAHGRLGAHLLDAGEAEAAAAHYQAELDIDRALMAEDPASGPAVRDSAIALDGLARCRLAAGDADTALAVHRDVLTIRANLATLAPDDADAARDLAVAHRALGVTLLAREANTEAVAQFDAALAIWQRLADADPSDLEAKFDMAMTRLDAGDAFGRDGAIGGAALRFTLARAALQEIVAADPVTGRYAAGLATAHAWLGGVRAHEGALDEAEELLMAALKIREDLAAARPKNRARRYDLAVACFSLGALETQRDDIAKAIDWFARAEATLTALIEDRPDDGYAQLRDMIRTQIERLRESG